ncbi:MAG: insulinase family protein [Acidimicrobiia bacterium]|nr:insulinase family protein [Acidimicrobiia bacterium]
MASDHAPRPQGDSVAISAVGEARVITEAMPDLRSVAVGFWVGSGAVDESDAQFGASHFLEHLLFKGTEDRSASEIAAAVESVGGDMNAFTTQEYTAFYVRVPDDHLTLALDILADVVWRPSFRPDEVESERRVILEEIGMRDDTPDDVVHELANAALFDGHPLGRSVLGTRDSISAMSRDAIVDYHARHYVPSNVVIAAAGNLDHRTVVDHLGAHVPDTLGNRPARHSFDLPAPARSTGEYRATEQAHLVVSLRSIARDDPDRYALSVVNQVLGGGMSSRLFQEIRERRGLAYSVYAYRAAYESVGSISVYAGTAPETVGETLDVIRAELTRLVGDGIPESELAAAKGHLKGATTLALETSSSRMHRLGRGLLTLGEVPNVDEIVAAVEAVTVDDLRRTIDRVFATDEHVLSVVGPLDVADFDGPLAT